MEHFQKYVPIIGKLHYYIAIVAIIQLPWDIEIVQEILFIHKAILCGGFGYVNSNFLELITNLLLNKKLQLLN